MLDVYIDADACPVKEEVYRVALRYGLRVFVVSNTGLRVPAADWLRAVVLRAYTRGRAVGRGCNATQTHHGKTAGKPLAAWNPPVSLVLR